MAVDPARLKDDVRKLMRKVPASVAIITVAHNDPESGSHVPMGIAVSSLNTVTLDPPTVSFNIKEPSKALDAIRAADGRFRVHFLEGIPLGRTLIEHFCAGNHAAAYEQRKKHLQMTVPQSRTIAPQLQGEAVRAAAECMLTQEMTVGDHVVLVAQVKRLEKKDMEEAKPTVVYVDGTYRSLQSSTVIGHHGTSHEQTKQQTGVESQVTDEARELSFAYDYPLFPGQQDRHEYAERLKAYFSSCEIDHPKDFVRRLQPQTRSIASAFGIDLEALLHLHKRGEPMRARSIFPEFYGQLSATQMAKLVNRAKVMVKTDARFLSEGYVDLLRHLDIHIGYNSVLPSDILNALRAEGLVEPFQENPSVLQALDRYERQNRNIFYMEQAEHALRKYILTLTDPKILRMSLPVKLEQAGVDVRELPHFQGAHTRLKVESCSTFYKGWTNIVSGDVTPEEARVVVQRLIKYLHIERQQVFMLKLREEVSDMMRNTGIHPLITGVDANLLISKIRYLYSTIKPFPAFKEKLEELLQPSFASNVTWEDLEARIKQFVQAFPLRATTWKNSDQLAAMGLRGTTTITTAISSKLQTLDESGLVETLVAKALRGHYGKGTDEENEAIADCLRERYNYDVVSRSVVAPPEEVLTRSSADDLEAYRLANEEVHVPIRKMAGGHEYVRGERTFRPAASRR